MRTAAAVGFDGWGLLLAVPKDMKPVSETARANGLQIPSAFVSGNLISGNQSEVDHMEDAALASRDYGARPVSAYPAAPDGTENLRNVRASMPKCSRNSGSDWPTAESVTRSWLLSMSMKTGQ